MTDACGQPATEVMHREHAWWQLRSTEEASAANATGEDAEREKLRGEMFPGSDPTLRHSRSLALPWQRQTPLPCAHHPGC